MQGRWCSCDTEVLNETCHESVTKLTTKPEFMLVFERANMPVMIL